MNSKKVFSRGRCGGTTLTPPVPTTTASPFSIWPMGTHIALPSFMMMRQSIWISSTSSHAPRYLTEVKWFVVE